MHAMNNQTLPIPNPHDWMTVSAAAQFMRVDRRTIVRMVERRTLTAHQPYAADGEKPPLLLWRDEVIVVRNARIRASAGGAGGTR